MYFSLLLVSGSRRHGTGNFPLDIRKALLIYDFNISQNSFAMDIFDYCWLTLLDESKKCSVFFDKNTCNVKNDIDENFNKPVNRIAYLYKFGSFNISFFHRCFEEFFAKAPDSTKIIDNFRSLKNLTICSMSVGPGMDIIGLLYSLHLINKPLINSTAFKVISRHGSWRNLVNEMVSSSIISVPDASTCKLIECDFLKELNLKAKGYLKAADVLLMCNSFSSSMTTEKIICNILERIHQLKPGALVFFIVNKEKSAYLHKMDSFGSFLYGPVEVTLEKLPFNEKISEIVGVKPQCSGTSLFAVWQKISETNSETNLQKEKECDLTVDRNQDSSANLINSKSDTNKNNSQFLSMSSLNRKLSNDANISSSDSTISSYQFSSSSNSSQIINMRETDIALNSPCFSGHTYFSEKNIHPPSVNVTDSTFGKKCRSGPKNKEINGNNSMDSLLKSFSSLITKFEGLINSQDSLQNSDLKEKQSLSGQQCHQSHSRCSVKSCQFKGNGAVCCCNSMVCCNDKNQYCSTFTSNLYRILPQEGPCIVIPLQNLSNESLSHILSIVSQNSSSVNNTSTSK